MASTLTVLTTPTMDGVKRTMDGVKRRKLSLLTALVTMLTVLVFPTGGVLADDIGPIDCVTPGEELQTVIDDPGTASGDIIIIADGSVCAGNFNVSKPLTIRAKTAAGATLDGGGINAGPVVSVTTGGNVTLQNLTITGGLNTVPNTGLGGGVASGSATVSLVDSIITGNAADTGAGIYNGGTLTITGGSITDNVATTSGGGIFSNGTATLSGVTIGTAALPNTAANGGGASNTGVMTVDSLTTVDSNTATALLGGGGGIWNDGTLNIDSAFVTGNVAVDAGGGIHNISGGVLTVMNASEITGNQAALAGGILNNGASNTGSTAIISDSLVSSNDAVDAAGLGGGGIFNFSFVDDTVKAQLTVERTTVSDNTSAADGAAGIRNADGNATLDTVLVEGNVAVGSGGGIRTSGTMDITDSTISGNSSDAAGGGISLDGDSSTLTVTGSTIDGNDAADEGGGISLGLTTSADIIGSSITRNTAPAGAGISNAGTVDITNSSLSGNMTTTQGGGILTSGDLTVSYSTITGNDATIEGGGVRAIGTPMVTLTGTILHGNTGGSGEDCAGPLASGGFNLMGLTAPPCVYTGDPTDLPALSDPMLGPLGFYGESTEHHPLLAGSDAIDAGGACGLTEDQIGAARPEGQFCDAGAIEGIAIEGTATLVSDEVLLVEPNGRWHVRIEGQPDRTFWYGDPGDIPLLGDWDGDGIDTPGAWRQGPGGGFAYMTNSLPADGQVGVADFNFFFGTPGDEVLVGDWNDDGIDTLGINRGGHMFLTDTNGSGGLPVPTDYDFFFGVPGDRAFGGDPDGNGKDSVFLYRAEGPGAGFVYYTNQTPVGPGAVAATADNFFFGIASDSFVSGDWDGNDVDTAGIFRGSDTTVYLTNTNASGGAPAPTDVSYVWGTAGWIPLAGMWANTP